MHAEVNTNTKTIICKSLRWLPDGACFTLKIYKMTQE